MKYLMCIIMTIFPLLSFSQGGVISGGGDSFSAEFVKIGYDLFQMLENSPIEEISNDKFLEAVQNTKVNSAYTVTLNGEEVDAINTPSLNHILINRRRWIDTATDYKKRLVLVAHEYLGILGVDDSNYQVSHKIFQAQGGFIQGSYFCEIPILLKNDFVLDTIKLELIIYRNEFTQVKTDSELMLFIPSTLVTFRMYDVDIDTFKVSRNILVTIQLGDGLKIVDLPYEVFGKKITSGGTTAKVLTYPSKHEMDISCTFDSGELK